MASHAIWTLKCTKQFYALDESIPSTLLIPLCCVYFDDSKDEDGHFDHIRKVLEVLTENELYINLKKCVFLETQLLFLGFFITCDGIHVDDSIDDL